MLDGVIAIDGGNSKTDVLVVAREGTVLGRARGPAASPQTVGVPACMTVLDDLVRRAVQQAGGPPDPPYAVQASAFLAGLDYPREQRALAEALTGRGWAPASLVDNDTFALLRSGSPDGYGVAVVCGAGINCVASAPDGRTLRFPALGRLSGDWGGGRYLSEEALWWAVRAEDGRGPDTALLPAIATHFGLSSVAELVERVHFGEVPRWRLHEINPVLFAVAGAGDAVARGIVDRLAEEVVLFASAALRRLDLLDTRVDVILGGGVLAGGDGYLLDRIRDRCTAAAPHAVPRVVSVPPVVGAALLGLDAMGADRSAEVTLRARFAGGPGLPRPDAALARPDGAPTLSPVDVRWSP